MSPTTAKQMGFKLVIAAQRPGGGSRSKIAGARFNDGIEAAQTVHPKGPEQTAAVQMVKQFERPLVSLIQASDAAGPLKSQTLPGR
ncbi:hypothetical protein QA640_39235 [Bradyrhizobium sp. CB82]|uniref:hypothetical protein n=1 Tax=Bradyrhizobium sp. CB82 TaxID=3039159 RepID=UPI0024B1EAAF|nr:hypothetical protein [Bradyrhizobium sp. CB82]WFU40178.1 hypothetical protein QA640_39235 [Bradyrhizobium sp. CB82]